MTPSRRSPDAPLSCREVRRLMQAFLDGELPDSQTYLVAAHLEDCERCGVDADTYREVKAALRRLRPELDADALERLERYTEQLADAGPDGSR